MTLSFGERLVTHLRRQAALPHPALTVAPNEDLLAVYDGRPTTCRPKSCC
jgi:hypothetical protein